MGHVVEWNDPAYARGLPSLTYAQSTSFPSLRSFLAPTLTLTPPLSIPSFLVPTRLLTSNQ